MQELFARYTTSSGAGIVRSTVQKSSIEKTNQSTTTTSPATQRTMSYNNAADRDALFGSAGGGGSKKKKKAGSSNAANREQLFGSAAGGGGSSQTKSSSSSSRRPSDGSKPAPTQPSTSKGYQYVANKKKKPVTRALAGEKKEAKMREADECCGKAKKALQRGLFSKPDPLAASTYYKRGADAYQLCGETGLERTHRMNSADCQMKVGAWATAAADYTRAAELLEDAEDETIEMKREMGRKLHLNAAEAWKNMNEPSKAAGSKVQAALALIWGTECSLLPKMALQALEEAVEAHVPDPLNPYARYRETGASAYIDAESEETAANPSQETLEFAKQHIVSRSYSHEPVQEIVYIFVSFGEYPSALYAAGAATAILANDGISTLTLSRAFVVETILTLAMGDPVAAEDAFLNRHVQKNSYLDSRECKLAEELFRAVKARDGEALDEARSAQGSNRSALANLHESIRDLVPMLRISGVARRGVPETYSKNGSKEASKSAPSIEELSKKTGYEEMDKEAANIDKAELQDELDALNFGDDDDDDELDNDDEFDLR